MEHNLFALAPKELTGSAFWAWVLQSICVNNNEDKPELVKLAKRFLNITGIQAETIGWVKTEVKCGSGRVDIVLYDKQKKPSLIIENKVWSTPKAEDITKQIRQYAEDFEQPNLKMLAMSWRYDTECLWESNCHIVLLTLKKQCELLHGIKHPIVEEYAQHAKHTLSMRDKDLEKILSDSIICNLVSMSSERPTQLLLDHYDTQWRLLSLIMENMQNITLYNGTSSGRPWTQAGFEVDGKDFFYRLDKAKKGFYLRLNYYTDEKQEGKQSFMSEIKSKNLQHPNWMEWVCSYPNGKESTLWYAWLNSLPLSVKEFREQLSGWHQRFIRSF